MPPTPDRVPARRAARSEIEALLAEIPDWDDRLLLKMRQRFATSRLFRHRHAADGPLTPAAQRLLAAAEREIAERGLAPLPDDDQSEQGVGYWDLPPL